MNSKILPEETVATSIFKSRRQLGYSKSDRIGKYMHNRKIESAIFLVMLLVFAGTGYSQSGSPEAAEGILRVIAHRDSPIREIHVDELKKLYLGKEKEIQGVKVEPLHLHAKSKERKDFHKQVLKLSLDQYREEWLKAKLFGAGTSAKPPRSYKSVKSLFILANKKANALGYLYESPTSKALEAEGHIRLIPIRGLATD